MRRTLALLFAIAFLSDTPAVAQVGGSSHIPFSFTASGLLVPASPDYFVLGTTVTRFVNPTTGLDTNDGLTAGTAWLSVQRALDDVPQGFTANPQIQIAAGTFTFASQQTWVLHSVSAVNTVVRIIGDCTTPQATFTTTGAGTAVVFNGVTKLAQFTFTPTVATGSIPGAIADGDFWFSQVSTAPTDKAVLASTTPNIVLAVTAGTALSTNTPRLCPFATVFSQVTNVGTDNLTAQTGGTALSIHGIKFTLLNQISGATLSGAHITSPAQLTARDVNIIGSFVASHVAYRPTRFSTAITNSVFAPSNTAGPAVQLDGSMIAATFDGNIFKGSTGTNCKIAMGDPFLSVAGGSSLGASIAASSAAQFIRNDLEGTGCGVFLANSALTNNSGLVPMMSLDITGRPFDAAYRSVIVLNGATSGKYTVASSVRAGASVYMRTTWGAVNTVLATDEWVVGAAGTKAAADLPVTDAVELVRVSNAAY